MTRLSSTWFSFLHLRKEYRLKIDKYLRHHPCIDCGESDIIMLEFDHIRGQKRGGVTTLIRHTLSWEVIQAEIEKCVVRCANCHKRKTAKQFGWLKANTLGSHRLEA